MPKFPNLRPEDQVRVIEQLGGTLPRNPARKQAAAWDQYYLAKTDPDGPEGFSATVANSNAVLSDDFRRRRFANRRYSAGSAGDMISALPKFYDPKEFWQISGMPYDVQDDLQRKRLYEWLRLFYMTHTLIPTLIDIFTRFPLVGIELNSKDKKLAQWYEDLFFDQLDYAEFLVRLGREYWTVGQAFPLGSYNQNLGIWEHEQIINPDDIVLKHFPLLNSTTFEIKPPDYLVDLASTRRPPQEYAKLERDFPELVDLLRKRENIPVSSVLMRQVAFRINDWDLHGTPILLRALRTLMHEEKLTASQDAIAERLYSPLILAKLGIQDIGDGSPWMPGPDETAAFRDDLDMALSSDYRLLVHHFGVDIQSVFGREQMPRLDADFDRIEKKLMQVFGVNPSLLSAPSGNAQPYASSALQAEFLNQILKTYQDYLKKHYIARAEVVAEANEHYDYEKRGDTRVPIMEEVQEYDEESGEWKIRERPKLLIPELSMKVLDLRDEATQRQFLQQLKASGVPISDQTFMVGMPTTFEDELEQSQEEVIKKTLAQQEAKLKIAKACMQKGYPIPPGIIQELAASGINPLGDAAGGGQIPGQMGIPGMDPTGGMGGDMMGGDMGGMPGGGPPGGLPGGMVLPGEPGGGGLPPAAQPMGAGPRGAIPDISHERTPLRPPGFMSKVEKTNENGEVEKIVYSLPKEPKGEKISIVDKSRSS